MDANDIATVFPIELRHEPAPPSTSSSDFLLSSFPEIEFQDCSAYVNFDAIKHRAVENSQAYTSSAHKDSNALSLGKRRVADEDNSSRKHARVSDGLLHVASTSCRFLVVPRGEYARDKVEALEKFSAEHGESTILRPDQISLIQTVPFGKDVEEGSLIHNGIKIEGKDGVGYIVLPVVNSDKVAWERSPHRFTNGAWLLSAVHLCHGHADGKLHESNQLLCLEASLVLSERKENGLDIQSSTITLEVHFSLYLNLSGLRYPISPLISSHVHRLIRFGFPNDDEERQIRLHDEFSARDVYSALKSSKLPPLEAVQSSQLNAAMFPFQRRSVHFMLGREGKQIIGKDEDGGVLLGPVDGQMASDGVRYVGIWWQQLADGLYYSPLLCKFAFHAHETLQDHVSGGILAEEMGLGKTVEVYALVLLNSDEERSTLPPYEDKNLDVIVSPTKSTLIVSPEVLRQQWLDEASLHAPGLRAFSYRGYKDAAKHIPAGKSWAEFARQFDVIVVSYDVLRKEVNVARKAPQRFMRHDRKYERPRSFLIQLAFHRVVMDEVQLVGHASAAETVSMIARRHSLAVSGTPIKQLSDLKSLFNFLRVPGPLFTERDWARVVSPPLLPSLSAALSLLATRHSKPQVQNEMILPQQTRILVPIKFTAIESAFYRDIFQRGRHTLGIDTLSDPSKPALLRYLQSHFADDVGQLRSIVLALRQACTHPQISTHGGRGNVLATSQSIRSMDEVLVIMIEGTISEYESTWHTLVQKRIDRAILLLQKKEFEGRHDIARAMLQSVRPDIEAHIATVKSDLKKAYRIGPLYRFDKGEIEIEGALDDGPLDFDPTSVLTGSVSQNGHQKSQEEREGEHEMAEKKLHRARHVTTIRSRLRNFLEQLHRSDHILGNVFFQMGEKARAETKTESTKNGHAHPMESSSCQEIVNGQADEWSAIDKAKEEAKQTTQEKSHDPVSTARQLEFLKEQEDAAYNRAEDVRQELLKESRKVVEQSLKAWQRNAISFDLLEIESHAHFGSGGLRTNREFDMLVGLEEKLNENAKVVFEWRQEILVRLQKAVSRDVSAEDENDDQYQENLDAQAEAEALLEMFRVLLSEREYMLTGVKLEGTLGRPQLYAQLEREVPQFEKLQRRLLLWEAQGGSEVAARPLAKDDYMPTDQELVVMRQQLEHLRKLEKQKNRVAISFEAKAAEDRNRRKPVQMEAEGQEEITFGDFKPFEIIVRELRDVIQSVDGREEAAIARLGMEKARQLVAKQRQYLEKLKRESSSFSVVWNARAAYFKQIQELSDQVGDIQTTDVDRDMKQTEKEEVQLRQRESVSAGRLRYLRAIEEEAQTTSDDTETEFARNCRKCARA